MPKNKIRKKKSSKNKSNKKKHLKEEYLLDGIKLKREGKVVFIENKRTKEEHQKYIEEVTIARPNVYNGIKDLINKIESTFATYDNIKLLGGIAYYHFLNMNQVQKNTNNQLSETLLEYGLSFATATQENPVKEPNDAIIEELVDIMEYVKELYSNYISTEFITKKYSDLEQSIRIKTIAETLYVRGQGYKQHIETVYLELFSGHNNFLQENYNFNSVDILEAINQLNNSFLCRMLLPNGLPPLVMHARFKEWANKNTIDEIAKNERHFIDLFGDDNPDIIIKESKILAYRIDQIETYNELYKIRPRTPKHQLIIEKLSQQFGSNKEFINPKYKGFPINDSTIFTKPIIQFNNSFYLFSLSLPIRNLFNITESLILEVNKTYYNQKYLGNKYNLSRDNYLEQKAASLLGNLIKNAAFYQNCKYKPENNEETEVDLLIISEYANYIVEMKAGGLRNSARRGAIESLSGQLKDTVGYGAYQNYRAFTFINEDKNSVFYNEQNDKIIVDKHKKTFRITITLENLSGLITYLYDLKQLGVISNNVDFAWTVSIFDLIIFTEILESEQDFIEYLEKRIPLYKRPELHFDDEIDILGYFLDENLILNEEIISKTTYFQFNNYSSDIDDFYERGKKKPKRKKRS